MHAVRISRISLLVFLLCLMILPAAAQDSPDAILFATLGEDRYSLFLVDSQSEMITEVGEVGTNGGDAGWSPDGRYIHIADQGEELNRTLSLFDTETSSLRTISSNFDGNVCNVSIWWSPTSENAAYFDMGEQQYQVNVYDPMRDETFPLLVVGTFQGFITPQWSHDGRYLSVLTDSNANFYTAQIWDVGAREIVSEIEFAHSQRLPLWSPVDNRIAYVSADDPGEVVIHSLNGGTDQHFTGEQLGDWSPDGRHLSVYREDADSDLHLSVIDTLDETVWEYADGEVVRDTRWSPDGRYIIFQSIHLAFTFQRDIYAFDVVEETLHPLTDVPVLPGHFTWSTMEHRVAFAANDGTLATPFTTLWIYDLEQQSSQRFDMEIPTSYFEPPLTWSPDGRYLAIYTNLQIALFDRETGSLEATAVSLEKVLSPRWSSDGDFLSLVSIGKDNEDIYLLNPQTGALRQVTHTPDIRETFLGWQGVDDADSLIYCGIG